MGQMKEGNMVTGWMWQMGLCVAVVAGCGVPTGMTGTSSPPGWAVTRAVARASRTVVRPGWHGGGVQKTVVRPGWHGGGTQWDVHVNKFYGYGTYGAYANPYIPTRYVAPVAPVVVPAPVAVEQPVVEVPAPVSMVLP
jgi:hypothetical protein